ncbi:MAG: polyprenyl synthetase family protein [Acidobacteriota bacterium]|nr:polyprenyl synthetase family protein [Acidobacteriota bacterium]
MSELAAPPWSGERVRVFPLAPLFPRTAPESRGESASRRPGDRSRFLSDEDYAYLLDGYRSLLPAGPEVQEHLRGVIADTVAHPGSLVRAQLVFALLQAHGHDPQAAREVAVAVEYFHTASLIFDDMPAMDDAAERRGHPCPHRVYGEAAATLGALGFITRAYALLWRALGELPPERSQPAAELVGRCLGVAGILNGQSLDLHYRGGGEDAVLAVAEGKTVSLIRLTLMLPALIVGTAPATLRRLDRLSTVWGLAYQAVDDFKDALMSGSETGKSPRRDGALGRPNLPGEIGRAAALERLDQLLAEGEELLGSFVQEPAWESLDEIQDLLHEEQARIRRRIAALESNCSCNVESCA